MLLRVRRSQGPQGLLLLHVAEPESFSGQEARMEERGDKELARFANFRGHLDEGQHGGRVLHLLSHVLQTDERRRPQGESYRAQDVSQTVKK